MTPNEQRLREALEGLLGARSKPELTDLALGVLASPVPDEDKGAALSAIQTLLETMEELS